MSNAAITGGIISAQHRKQLSQQTLSPYSRPSRPPQVVQAKTQNTVQFGMGWREDLDDVMLRLHKIQNAPDAPEWAKNQAEASFRDVREAEQLGEKRKGTTELMTTVSAASFGSVLGPIGAAVAGVGGVFGGKSCW